jgi:hypothetical protein
MTQKLLTANAESLPCPCPLCGSREAYHPWFNCRPQAENASFNWHFSHGPQWTPRKEQLRAEAARKPFGDISPE